MDRQNGSRRGQGRHVRTKRIAVCAMLVALGVIIVWIGALLDVLELSVVVLAAMLLIPVVIEYGGAYPWLIYAGTALLSLLLMPLRMVSVVYALFGFYPILKAYFERLPRLVTVLLKQLYFIGSDVLTVWLSYRLVTVEELPTPWFLIALCAIGYGALNLLDVALTRLITLYLRKYRSRVSRLMN